MTHSSRDASIPFFVRRFVAGTQAEDAVRVAKDLAEQGISSTCDLLGENLTDAEQIRASADAYIHLLDCLHEAGLSASISIKLTMLGLDLDESVCHELTSQVVARADHYGGRVCLDMEGSAYTERTLRMYERLCKDHTSPEIVLQASLHRTREDIERVLAANGRMRLCKGAYKEPPERALQRPAEIQKTFLELLERPLAAGQRICIATHDDTVIEGAKAIIAAKGIDKERYEFQMLYGLRRRTWRRLRAEGHHFTVYVPYGVQWQPYYQRRLMERKENVFFILRNVFRN